jgi:hypothetical protein
MSNRYNFVTPIYIIPCLFQFAVENNNFLLEQIKINPYA